MKNLVKKNHENDLTNHIDYMTNFIRIKIVKLLINNLQRIFINIL